MPSNTRVSAGKPATHSPVVRDTPPRRWVFRVPGRMLLTCPSSRPKCGGGRNQKRELHSVRRPSSPLSVQGFHSVDGRSPGSRFHTHRRPSRITPVAGIGDAFTDYSCGGSPGWRAIFPLRIPFSVSLRRTINVPKSSGTDSRESSVKALYVVFQDKNNTECSVFRSRLETVR